MLVVRGPIALAIGPQLLSVLLKMDTRTSRDKCHKQCVGSVG